MRAFSTLLISMAALSLSAQGSFSFSLSDKLNQSKPSFQAKIDVACGKLDKANCAQVLPHLAEHTVTSGLTLVPADSEGSTQSAIGVCQGLVQAAIGQRDAFVVVRQKPECTGTFDQTGASLYPYYGYFVARADADFTSVEEMVSSTPNGKFRHVAAGKQGSGGQTTIAIILKSQPQMKRAISVEDYDQDTALQRIKDGSLDAYFVMDAPGSDLIERIKSDQTKDGTPNYKFLDLRLGDSFYNISDWQQRRLYQEVTVVSGGWLGRDVRSVSVDAVVITNNKWREDDAQKGPTSSNILAKAIDDSQAAIFGDTKTPKDWKPASSQQ